MLWVVYSLLHSLFRAAYVEAGRIFPISSWHMSFWQAVFGCIILTPLIPLMDWPSDARFYIAAMLVALILAVGILIQFNLAQSKHGRVSSIYMPLEALGAFVIWMLVDPPALSAFMGNLPLAAGIICAFFLATAGLLRIRPQDMSLSIFAVVAPVGVTYAVAGVVTKLVLPAQDMWPAALTYIFVSFLVTAAVTGFALLIKKKGGAALYKGTTLKAGVIAGSFSVLAYTTFVGAVVLAPNPGYVSMMAMLLPVWMMAFHGLIKVEDRGRRPAALMLVIGIVMLLAALHYF